MPTRTVMSVREREDNPPRPTNLEKGRAGKFKTKMQSLQARI